jgi:hypothetical protein
VALRGLYSREGQDAQHEQEQEDAEHDPE